MNLLISILLLMALREVPASTPLVTMKKSPLHVLTRSPAAQIRPAEVSAGFRPIYHGCPGYSYPALAPSCTTPSPLTQTIELVFFEPPFFDTNVVWTAVSMPSGLSLYDPDPTDNHVNIIGSPGVAGDVVCVLRAQGDYSSAEGGFTIRIRNKVTWTNVNDWISWPGGVLAGGAGYSSDGVMVFSGYTNWLFPADTQTLFWAGVACHMTLSPAVLQISVDPSGSTPATLQAGTIPHNLWQKSGTPTIATGGYDGTAFGSTPATAEIE